MLMLRGAERVWPTSGEARSADRERGGAERCQMARAWPRAAQQKFFIFFLDTAFYFDKLFM